MPINLRASESVCEAIGAGLFRPFAHNAVKVGMILVDSRRFFANGAINATISSPSCFFTIPITDIAFVKSFFEELHGIRG